MSRPTPGTLLETMTPPPKDALPQIPIFISSFLLIYQGRLEGSLLQPHDSDSRLNIP